jgi:hypothetical protein
MFCQERRNCWVDFVERLKIFLDSRSYNDYFLYINLKWTHKTISIHYWSGLSACTCGYQAFTFKCDVWCSLSRDLCEILISTPVVLCWQLIRHRREKFFANFNCFRINLRIRLLHAALGHLFSGILARTFIEFWSVSAALLNLRNLAL